MKAFFQVLNEAAEPITKTCAQIRNTDTTTDLNVDAPGITVPLAGFSDILDPGIAISGNGLELQFDGVVEVVANVNCIGSGNARGRALKMRFAVNGTVQTGPAFYDFCYDGNGYEEMTVQGSALLQVSNGDVVTVVVERAGRSGSLVMLNAESSLQVKRIG